MNVCTFLIMLQTARNDWNRDFRHQFDMLAWCAVKQGGDFALGSV